MLIEFLQDAFFAAIAAIGFAAISNPRAGPICIVRLLPPPAILPVFF